MTHPTIATWRTAGEEHDLDAAAGTLAADVVLNSPLTDLVRFEGKAAVTEILQAAFAAIDDIAYHTVLEEGSTFALFYNARVGDRRIEEAQLIRLDEAGNIGEVTFWLRPLPGTVEVMQGIGSALEERRHGGRAARSIRAKLRPLVALTRIIDRAGAKTAMRRER
ncbi:nuclear transport factor 2 family protein [Glycomyces albidus]|nr:nuclear transport factor 2 family protein [Glycomyces albidus]